MKLVQDPVKFDTKAIYMSFYVNTIKMKQLSKIDITFGRSSQNASLVLAIGSKKHGRFIVKWFFKMQWFWLLFVKMFERIKISAKFVVSFISKQVKIKIRTNVSRTRNLWTFVFIWLSTKNTLMREAVANRTMIIFSIGNNKIVMASLFLLKFCDSCSSGRENVYRDYLTLFN